MGSKLIDPFATATPVPKTATAKTGLVDPYANMPATAAPQGNQRVYDPDSPLVADAFDVGVASLANDPKARLRYYSKELNIPESQLQEHKGNIFARGNDGKFYNVEAGTMNQLAKGVGPSLPAVGGTVGGILGTSLGPAGTAAGGITGAVGGQTAREYLSQQIMGQQPSTARVVKEGALDLAATVTGLLIGKGLTKAAATRAGKELNSMMNTGGLAAMDALEEVLKKVNTAYGSNIKLTAAELSNSTKLRAQQMAVDNYPEQSQRMADFYKARAGESDTAYKNMIDAEFGADVGADVAGGRLIETEHQFPSAKEGIKQLRDMVMKVEQRDTPGGPVDHVKFESNLEVLQDGLKETLDDLISAAYTAGKGKLGGRYKKIQENLLGELDKQVPSFKVARDTWSELMTAKGIAEGGMIPTLAGKKLKDFEDMGRLFFNGTSPAEIGRVREAILKTEGGAESWNSVLRGYLDQQWTKAGRVYKSQLADFTKAGVVQPLTFWAEMIGDKKQMARLQKAMTTTQWHAFKNLTDVFEATGRATNFNSTTIRQSAGKDMLEGASWGGEAMKTFANPNPLTILSRAQEGVQNLITDGNVSQIVDVLTNGKSVKELLKISSRDTTRDKAALAVLKAFNIARTQVEAHTGAEEQN